MATITDPTALAAIQAVSRYELRQGNVSAEIVAGSCLPNTYIFGDADRQYTIPDYKNPSLCSSSKTDTIGMPVFIVQEDSSCCCRCCCPGSQPLYAKFYNSGGPPEAGNTVCGCIYTGHKYSKAEGEPFMTLERDGCDLTRKWLSCCGQRVCPACSMCCQEDMYIHGGDPSGKGKPGSVGRVEGGHFSRLLMPCGGGGCHPQIDVMENTSRGPPGSENTVAVVEGPTFMKGCLELICNTDFYFSSEKGKSGDLGKITRPKPEDCYNCLRMCCTNIDFYTVAFTDGYMKRPPEHKAAMLSSMVLLDYMFFEDDRPPCDCESTSDNKGVVIYITLCYMYFYGCEIPCRCCIVLHGQDGG